MSWEISIVVLFLGIAGLFLYIGMKGDNNQLPLKLIFITLALGSMLFALNSGVLIANSASIADSSISNSLISTVENGYKIMLRVFWLFLVITVLSGLFTVVDVLKKRRR